MDWIAFAKEWRAGYTKHTFVGIRTCCLKSLILDYRRRIAEGGDGPKNVDVLHREVACSLRATTESSHLDRVIQILDSMLASETWAHLGKMWDDDKRKYINLVWHRLNGISSRLVAQKFRSQCAI